MTYKPVVKTMAKDHPCYKHTERAERSCAEAWQKAAQLARENASLKSEVDRLKTVVEGLWKMLP